MAAVVPPVIRPASRSIYRSMTNLDIIEKLLLLKLCGFKAFVRRAHKLHSASASLLGERLTSFIMRHVMLKHFVAGDDYPTLKTVGERMLKDNVRMMLMPPMEDVAEHLSDKTIQNCRENQRRFLADQNLVVQLCQDLGTHSTMQLKLSAVFPSISMNELSTSCEKKRVPLVEAGGMIGDFYQRGRENVLDLLKSEATKEAFRTGLRLSKEIFEKSAENRIPLLIDAELRSAYTAMYAVYLGAASISAKNDIYVTFQCYMKDVHLTIKQTMAACDSLGVRFAAKIVRGAYLLLEREIALANGRIDPTCENAASTSKNYDSAIELIMNWIARSKTEGPLLCVASHNADSVAEARAKMEKLGIARQDPRVCFGQTYGMCDHITYMLGQEGYNVFKSTPYGKADAWAPYLSRRAAENHTAVMTARNEAPFYWQELRRRLRLGK